MPPLDPQSQQILNQRNGGAPQAQPAQPPQQLPPQQVPQQQAPQQAPQQQAPQPMRRFGGTRTIGGVPPSEGRAQENQAIARENLRLRVEANDRARAQFEVEQNAPPEPSVSQVAVDRQYAEDYVDWTTGGFSDFRKQREQLAGALELLQTQNNITGPIVGNTPDFVSAFGNQEAIDVRERVEEVVQRNLRLILGAQFTEREGERLIARAYNPRLDESVNARRVESILRQMDAAAEAKNEAARYFQDNGTLAGWQGVLPRMSDFSELDLDAPAPTAEQNTAHPDDIVDIMRRYGAN